MDVKLDGLKGAPDEVLLELAWAEGRILFTNDRGTMPRHFGERLAAGRQSAGVCVLSLSAGVGELIDALLLVWYAARPEEYIDVIEFLPYR